MSFTFRAVTAAALVTLVSAPAVAEVKDPINFGIISTESSQNLRQVWDPFLEDMSEKLGVEVRPFFASDYAGVIEGMRFDQVDVAWFGNASAMQAVDRAEGEVFAQTVAEDGSAGYWSVIIAPADSELDNLEDLLECDQSLDFGIGDPNSTSGFLVPTTFIFAANDITPQECFDTVRNANHETNALAVANRLVDAATNNTESMARIELNNPEAFVKIKEIWRSPLIPSDPIVWRSDLNDDTKEAVREFFMTYGTEQSSGNVEEELEVLGALEWAPFRPSTNAQLLPIRVMDVTRRIAAVEADETLSGDERASQIEALRAERAEYQAQIDAAD